MRGADGWAESRELGQSDGRNSSWAGGVELWGLEGCFLSDEANSASSLIWRPSSGKEHWASDGDQSMIFERKLEIPQPTLEHDPELREIAEKAPKTTLF